MKTRFVLKIDIINARRSGLLILCILLLGFGFSACSPASEPDPESLAGYVTLEENTLYLDVVEVITTEDKDRIAELDLSDRDMPNGYYIHDQDTETKSFELTDETVYTFTDYHLLFVGKPDSDRLYTTTKKEDFIQHLNTSFNNSFTGEVPYPLFIEVKDDKVISITEKFIFTQ